MWSWLCSEACLDRKNYFSRRSCHCIWLSCTKEPLSSEEGKLFLMWLVSSYEPSITEQQKNNFLLQGVICLHWGSGLQFNRIGKNVHCMQVLRYQFLLGLVFLNFFFFLFQCSNFWWLTSWIQQCGFPVCSRFTAQLYLSCLF